jgi:hypothetical protein
LEQTKKDNNHLKTAKVHFSPSNFHITVNLALKFQFEQLNTLKFAFAVNVAIPSKPVNVEPLSA